MRPVPVDYWRLFRLDLTFYMLVLSTQLSLCYFELTCLCSAFKNNAYCGGRVCTTLISCTSVLWKPKISHMYVLSTY